MKDSAFPIQLLNERRLSILTAAGFLLLLLSSLWLYWPGLSGTFLLDHELWIGPIGSHGGVVDWETFKLYLFEEPFKLHNRYLGRLTFLIDDQYWPAPPFNFKRTSLLIHLLNGSLLFALCLQIARILDLSKNRSWGFALAASAIWILHPLNHSTVLYASQRMTVVAAFFILLALITYIAGRTRIVQNPRFGAALIVLSLFVLTALGVLSKEIAIIIPLYVILLEFTLLRNHDRSTLWYWLASIGIGLPLLLGLIYGFTRWEGLFVNSYLFRDFTLTERLLTQGRVLAEYQRLIILPSLEGLGIFHDDFAVSRSWLEPASTLLAWIIHLMLIIVAVVWRHRIPMISFAILFFYIGHLLESTAIGLEIYFEHRNYVPMLGICLATAYYLMRPRKHLKILWPLTAMSIVLLLAFMTRVNTTVWEDPELQIEIALIDHPESKRAQGYWLESLIAKGSLSKANSVANTLIDLSPNLISPYLQKATLQCLTGKDMQPQISKLLMIAPLSGRDTAAAGNIRNLMIASDSLGCLTTQSNFWLELGQGLLSSERFTADVKSAQSAIRMITSYLSSKDMTSVSAELMEETLIKIPSQKLAIAVARIYTYLKNVERAKNAIRIAKELRPPFTATREKSDMTINNLEKKIAQIN
ncbi:MAG: hypothetical protein GY806_03050 [Gammaproteobacteria bacterium]|nr:hypothetical protein [Gammaproteobacteria bacterium]